MTLEVGTYTRELFFTTKPVGQGTGLGLSLVQAILHQHCGALEVQSRLGHTEFIVQLPVAPPTSCLKAA